MDLMNSSTLLRAAPRAVGAAALFGAMLGAPVGAVAAPAPAGEACVGDEGVTVVLDVTAEVGEVEVACAEGTPDSGRERSEERRVGKEWRARGAQDDGEHKNTG